MVNKSNILATPLWTVVHHEAVTVKYGLYPMIRWENPQLLCSGEQLYPIDCLSLFSWILQLLMLVFVNYSWNYSLYVKQFKFQNNYMLKVNLSYFLSQSIMLIKEKMTLNLRTLLYSLANYKINKLSHDSETSYL